MTASRTPHLSCDVTDVEGDKGSLYLLKAEWLVSVVDCPQDQISHCDFTHLFVRQSSSTPCHFILYFMFVPPATIHFIVFYDNQFLYEKNNRQRNKAMIKTQNNTNAHIQNLNGQWWRRFGVEWSAKYIIIPSNPECDDMPFTIKSSTLTDKHTYFNLAKLLRLMFQQTFASLDMQQALPSYWSCVSHTLTNVPPTMVILSPLFSSPRPPEIKISG